MKVEIIKFGEIQTGKVISVPEDLGLSMIANGQAKEYKDNVKNNKRSRNKSDSTDISTSEVVVEGNEE